jgi:prevent-host-death family protein
MRSVGMFEMKTHCSQVVEEAIKSGGICLTNRGKEVAVIISIDEYRRNKNAEFWRSWGAMKKKLNLTAEEVIAFRDEGRK